MGTLEIDLADQEDAIWAARNEHWRTRTAQPGRRRGKRERPDQPLILCGHGVILRVEHGALVIRNGFTHYPQERETFRFFPGSLDLPPRIIMLDGSGSLSFDVVTWLADQNVPLFRIDWTGSVVSVIGGDAFAQNPHKVRWQMECREHAETRLEFSLDLIADKVRASIDTLKHATPGTVARAKAIAGAVACLDQIESGALASVDALRLLEGRTAKAYFAAWRDVPLRWRIRRSRDIPEAWKVIETRRTVADRAPNNRDAHHPVNAMLNYGYACLYAQTQAEAAAAGYDPRLGIMHVTRQDTKAFALDLMERGRPVVDRALLNFLNKTMLSPEDFVIRKDGVCRLAPQLARRICSEVRATGLAWAPPGFQ